MFLLHLIPWNYVLPHWVHDFDNGCQTFGYSLYERSMLFFVTPLAPIAWKSFKHNCVVVSADSCSSLSGSPTSLTLYWKPYLSKSSMAASRLSTPVEIASSLCLRLSIQVLSRYSRGPKAFRYMVVLTQEINARLDTVSRSISVSGVHYLPLKSLPLV